MQTIDLNGTWQLSHLGVSYPTTTAPGAVTVAPNLPATIPAQVPGQVQLDLLRAGKIDDPYAGTNELKQRWIGLSDWVYRRDFTINPTLLAEPCVELVCEGLDTIAAISVNGKLVGRADNLVRCWRFNVKPLLKTGKNLIEITFRSPVGAAAVGASLSPYPVPQCLYMNGEPHANFVRKSGTHFGWDWGPCLLPVGIWRPIRIEAHTGARIEAVTSWQVHHQKGAVDLNVTAIVHSSVTAEAFVTFGVADVGETKSVQLTPGENKITVVLRIAKPKLWWPAGYGEQPLYSLRVTLDCGGIGDEAVRRIGFRRMELVREVDAAPCGPQNVVGESFYYRINGVPIYIKGANWIPADHFDGRVDRERYRNLLQSALDANMNLMRAWGGGIYEQDAFFELCDEMGLLVWQDFMFACMMYPADPAFLGNVREEARQQIRRIMNHPCVAMWCGNNENEDAIKWFPDSTANRDRYVVDYSKLYIDTIQATLLEEDPNRPFWPSSPSNGVQAWGNAQEQSRGDVHYWAVWHQGKPFSEYLTVVPRFSSEFGFQSFPSLETLAPVLAEDQRNVTAPEMEFRQRSPKQGNKMIIEHIGQQFRLPNGFENFIYVSQVLQALSIKTACEHWRRVKPYCMGSVYWQINDIWQGPSWSSLEYDGRWKLLHYYARRFFAPLMVSSFEKNGALEVWLTSDRPLKLNGHVTATLWSWTGKELDQKRAAFSLKPLDSKRAVAIPIADWVANNKTDVNGAFVTLSANTNATADGGAGEVVDNIHFLSAMKNVTLETPKIERAVKKISAREYEVTLTSDRVAPFVFLSAPKARGRFSDNGMLLMPKAKTTVRYFGWEDLDAKKFEKELTVKSLKDSY